MDPDVLLDQDHEGHLVHLALLNKAIEIEGKNKFEEYKILATLVGIETAKILAKVLS